MRAQWFLLTGLLLILGCKKDDPKPPEAAALEFPLQNSECTTGEDLDENTSLVEFRWMAAKYSETYELRVTNLLTDVTQNLTVQALFAQLPLEKGAPYSWMVITRNSDTQESGTSATWQFYNAGGETTYAPFPASILSPKSGASVVRNSDNEIRLEWAGADIDDDIESYEIYLDTVNPPQELITSTSAGTSSILVDVFQGTNYYWKIITEDAEGNRSDSGVYVFKVL